MISPTPKVLTEADLAGLPRAVSTPNDLPSVGTEDARPQSLPERVADKISKGILTGNDWPLTQDELDRLSAASWLRTLVSERDELASRVRELEGALWGCIAAIERTHHCTEEDRLASAEAARAALASKEQP